jgi:predicted RNA binding protein YcfA (HicA-like mRNA interferase family)
MNRRYGRPRKVRQLIAEVERAGMVLLPDRGKGSHGVFKHLESGAQVTISGHAGDDADRCQEGHVREALEAIRRWQQEREA